MPPPAEGLASRLFLGPALRTQPDRRLVTLVREGYETAFEEIVRRYAAPLRRYAAAIVGGHAEDVTQDSFSKALQALRRDGAEIELRPWLYRIVRNTALNDLRDRPRQAEALAETIAAGSDPAEELERREELVDLTRRLQALPEPQRAAIVMRELEGLGHEEIAAALGVSGGAARQAIHRARTALRDGVGLLLPLPLLRVLIDHGTEAVAAGTGAGGAAAAASGAIGGVGAGTALKAGVVTAVLAGSVGAGVALHEDRVHRDGGGAEAAAAPTVQDATSQSAPALAGGGSSGSGSGVAAAELGEDDQGGDEGPDDDRHSGDLADVGTTRGQPSGRDDDHRGGPGPSGPGRHGQRDPDGDDGPHRGGPGPSGHEGRGGRHDDGEGSHSGPEPGGSVTSGHRGGDHDGGSSGPGGGGSGSGHRGPGGGEGGEGEILLPPPPPPEEDLNDDDGSGSGSSGSGGGDIRP